MTTTHNNNFAQYPSLHERPVLISGGASGIGASLVKHFCQQGAKVAFIDINGSNADKTAIEALNESGNMPQFRVCDLKNISATLMAVKELETVCGQFAVLINNAGHDEAHAFDDVTPDYWDDRVAVNLRHQYFLAQHVSRAMKQEDGGSIINMGSISWMMGAVGVSAYTTLKSAVEGLTRSLARELGEYSVRVNSIAPGWVLTERQQTKAEQYPEKVKHYLTRQCLKNLLKPDDISRLALWLAADDSMHMTGQTLILDAGVI